MDMTQLEQQNALLQQQLNVFAEAIRRIYEEVSIANMFEN